MSATDIEHLIEVITEEVYLRLTSASPHPAGVQEGEEQVCPGCRGDCPVTCARRTERIVGAGACRVSMTSPVPVELAGDSGFASLIDHTLLKPEATRADILRLCEEARRYGFASVCINPYWVPLAAEQLRGASVKVCTVVGFPLGATLPSVKRWEAAEAVKLGAQEIDMVINVGPLRSGDLDAVRLDIRGVVEVSHAGCAIVKVILETALLDDEQKVAGCLLAQAAGADFVKTSTGFGPGGATAHDVELMRFVVGEAMGVKAAGGVRSLEDLKKMVSAGATRIGASASVKIIEEAAGRSPAAPPAGPAARAAGAPAQY
jgi:deoxyribose-phosphate aldolase